MGEEICSFFDMLNWSRGLQTEMFKRRAGSWERGQDWRCGSKNLHYQSIICRLVNHSNNSELGEKQRWGWEPQTEWWEHLSEHRWEVCEVAGKHGSGVKKPKRASVGECRGQGHVREGYHSRHGYRKHKDTWPRPGHRITLRNRELDNWEGKPSHRISRRGWWRSDLLVHHVEKLIHERKEKPGKYHQRQLDDVELLKMEKGWHERIECWEGP